MGMTMATDLTSLAEQWAWQRRARCRTAPQSLFFPGPGDDLAPARAICAKCPVQEECADYAIGVTDLKGIWAGLSEDDREEIRAAEREAATAEAVASEAGALDEVEEPQPAGEPRPQASRPGELYAVLEQLSQYPGLWARVARFASVNSAPAVASQLRLGRRRVPPGLWEFSAELNDEGGSDLHARYQGASTAEREH